MDSFRQELTELINRHSVENSSDTPDFILAAYLARSLAVFDLAMYEREGWYGRQKPHMNGVIFTADEADEYLAWRKENAG